MKTSESKNLNARLTETENGNMMPPPTPGLAHSKATTERLQVKLHDELYKHNEGFEEDV